MMTSLCGGQISQNVEQTVTVLAHIHNSPVEGNLFWNGL